MSINNLNIENFSVDLPSEILNSFEQLVNAEAVGKELIERIGILLDARVVFAIDKGIDATPKISCVWQSEKDGFDEEYALAKWSSANAVYEDGGGRVTQSRGFLQCVFALDNIAVGSVCVGRSSSNAWLAKEISAVEACARIFGLYLGNMLRLQKMHYVRIAEEIMGDAEGRYCYMLKDGSFEILHVSGRTYEIGLEVNPGDICYKKFTNRNEPCKRCPVVTGGKSIEKYNDSFNKWYTVNAKRVEIGNGRHATMVYGHDITEFKKRMNDADALTGLPTYELFKQSVEDSVQVVERQKAMVFLDFERFGEINDNRGIKIGNKILKAFSDFLQNSLGESELLCRYFSDVFLVYLIYDDAKQLKDRVERFQDALMAWNIANFPELELSLCAGVYPINNKAYDVDQMVEYANWARISIEDNSGYSIYDEIMKSRAEREANMENRMNIALENKEFVVYLQPRVDIKNSEDIMGCEALIRWHNASGNMMPMEFIPLFEKNGFIRHLDKYMCEQVVAIIREWLDEGKDVVPISINICTANIKDRVFVAEIIELLIEYRIPPYLIEVELQSDMYTVPQEVLALSLNMLRKHGVRFSANELGKSAEAFNLLQTLPIDVLNLDLLRFDHKHLSEKERMMFAHIIRLAKSLDMRVLCVGIEDEIQKEAVKDAGCDIAQGYLFGSPVNHKIFGHALK